MYTAPEPDPDESPSASPRRWTLTLPRRGTYVRDATLWWDDWVPVATTGWGAAVLIAPLLVARVLVRAAGTLRDPRRQPAGSTPTDGVDSPGR